MIVAHLPITCEKLSAYDVVCVRCVGVPLASTGGLGVGPGHQEEAVSAHGDVVAVGLHLKRKC